MALLNSLFSGVSGLQNLQTMMDVIGDNIANVDTIGYKGSRITFSDTFNNFVKSGTNPTDSSGGTNSFQIGLGMKVNSIDRNWNQGTFESTGITSDLALQGPGMFILNSNGENYYSRAGAFTFDANGQLVDPQNGAVVQGKVANGLYQIPQGTSIQNIVIDKNLRLPAIKTAKIVWGGNLQSNSPTIRTSTVDLTGNLKKETPQSVQTYPGNAYNATDPTTYQSTIIQNKDGASFTLRTWYTEDTTGAWTANWDVYSADNTTEILAAPGSQALGTPDATSGNFTTSPTQITNTTNNIDFTLNYNSLSNIAADSQTATSVNKGETATPVMGSETIYDSLGNPHTLQIEFDHLDSGKWAWTASIPATDGTLSSPSSGTINFDASGSIASVFLGTNQVTTTPPIPQIIFAPSNGSENQPLNLNFGLGTSGITQTSLTSQVAALSQDGSPSATLSNLNIDQYGNIDGIFSNGNSKTLAQIMVATFSNLNGLISAGNNLYSVAANSGTPRIDVPGETSATTIQSGALEQSNVDLSQEFTNMIVSQRGFQANAKVITTADQLLQVITNLIQ